MGRGWGGGGGGEVHNVADSLSCSLLFSEWPQNLTNPATRNTMGKGWQTFHMTQRKNKLNRFIKIGQANMKRWGQALPCFI